MSPKKNKNLRGRGLIEIDSIEEPYTDYPESFLAFVKDHGLNAPRITSNNGQGLALLLHHPEGYANRVILTKFFRKIGMLTTDAIQTVNKTEQWGLKRSKGYLFYSNTISDR